MPQKHPAPYAGRKQSALICWNTHEQELRAERQAGRGTPRIINPTNNLLTGGHLIRSLSPSPAQGRRRMPKPGRRSGSPEQIQRSSPHTWQGSSYVKSRLNQRSGRDARSGEGRRKASGSSGYEGSAEEGDGAAARAATSTQRREQLGSRCATSWHLGGRGTEPRESTSLGQSTALGQAHGAGGSQKSWGLREER